MNTSSPKISCRNPIFIQYLQTLIQAGLKFSSKDRTEITDLNFRNEQLYIGEISANSFFKERKNKKTIQWLDHLYFESGGKLISVKKLCLPFKDVKRRNKTQETDNPVIEKEVNTLNIKITLPDPR